MVGDSSGTKPQHNRTVTSAEFRYKYTLYEYGILTDNRRQVCLGSSYIQYLMDRASHTSAYHQREHH